jgi:hypothetical protein
MDCSARANGAPSCPEGFGCDSDAVCRKATGELAALPDRILGSAFSLATGDFDGDGQADVLSSARPTAYGLTKLRLHYFDRAGAPAFTWTSSNVLSSPVPSELTGDGRSDIVFAAGGGIGLVSGELDGSVISEAQPSYFLPAGVEALAAEPVIADLFEDDTRFPCLDLVLAYRGAGELTIYSTCERAADSGELEWRDEPLLTTLVLDPPAALERGLIAADLDGDGHLDQLAGTQRGPNAANAAPSKRCIPMPCGRPSPASRSCPCRSQPATSAATGSPTWSCRPT